MSNLIEKLTQLQHLTPDEIVLRIGDPFAEWRPGDGITEEEYEAHRGTRVILADRRNGHVNDLDRYEIGRWRYVMWSDNWLGLDYMLRSERSYDENPYPPTV